MNVGTSWTALSGSVSLLTLCVGFIVGGLLLVGMAVVFTRMRKIRREYRETLAKRYDSKDILCHDNLAHYLGKDSVEGKQSRGKGVLVLAQDELYFLQLHPRQEFCISLKRIKRVVTPTKFLDIVSPNPLLQVNFQEEDGTLSSVAWRMRDVTTFTEFLKTQRKKAQPRKRK